MWLLLSLPIFFACDFGDTNTDPTELSDVDVNLILPSLQVQTARNQGSIGARVTGAVIQHFEGLNSQPLAYTSYQIDENTLDTYWESGLYAGAMKDAKDIIDKESENTTPHYTGIAKIYMACNLGIVASFWGDAPYSTAFDESNPKSTYDTQEELYAAIQELLDEAIEDLQATDEYLEVSSDDQVYAGDLDLWTQTARALKARYYMHLVKRDDAASSNALSILAEGTISSNDDQPTYTFGTSENAANPLAYYSQERSGQIALGVGLLELLDANDDPRKSVYGVLDDDYYMVYESGNTELFYGQYSSPMPLISYSEVLFIMAEASLREGNLSDADDYFQQAVESNFDFLGIPDTISVGDLTSLSTFEERLELIIGQKYIALYGHGTLEAWVDYKRTGYPVLTPSADASESFDPSGVVPRRYIYPYSERTTNSDNMEAAVENQGGELLDDDTWAFQD